MKKTTLASVLALATTSIHAQPANLLFHAAFEDTVVSESGQLPTHAQNITFTKGAIGGGLQLGNNVELDYRTQGIVNLERGAISFWVQPQYDPQTDDSPHYLIDMFDRYEGGSTFSRIDVRMSQDPNGYIRAGVNPHTDGGPEETVIFTPNNWTQNSLHHVVLNYDMQNAVQFYIDGTLVAQSSENLPNTLAALPALLNVGYYKDTRAHYFPGMIDELKIWDSSLSQSEVLREYNVPGPAISLIIGSGILSLRRRKNTPAE